MKIDLKLSDIEIGKAKVVGIRDREVAIFRKGDRELYVVDNICPHQGGPLGEGYLEDFKVICPWHAWDFDIRNGSCGVVPEDRIRSYKVSLEGEVITIEL